MTTLLCGFSNSNKGSAVSKISISFHIFSFVISLKKETFSIKQPNLDRKKSEVNGLFHLVPIDGNRTVINLL